MKIPCEIKKIPSVSWIFKKEFPVRLKNLLLDKKNNPFKLRHPGCQDTGLFPSLAGCEPATGDARGGGGIYSFKWRGVYF